MMPSQSKSNPSASIDQFQDNAINIVHNLCSIVCMPVELALRPFHGTRYFSPLVMFFSMVMMILIPTIFSFAGAVQHILPFSGGQVSLGLIGMWGLSKLFFLGCLIHGIRKWRLMLHMEREENSMYAGPALFFFAWLPKATFFRIRIIYEPLLLVALAVVLPNFFILEPAAANVLVFSAVFLAMKNFTQWYMEWQFIREWMDVRFMGPKLARLAENTADDEELGSIHMASFPKDLPPDMRQAAVAHIARIFSTNDSN